MPLNIPPAGFTDMRGRYRPMPDPFTTTSRFLWHRQPTYVDPSWYPGQTQAQRAQSQQTKMPRGGARDVPNVMTAPAYSNPRFRLNRPHSIAVFAQMFPPWWEQWPTSPAFGGPQSQRAFLQARSAGHSPVRQERPGPGSFIRSGTVRSRGKV
jgi:hypothetical protein